MEEQQEQVCKHPPERLYTGFYTCFDNDCQPYERQWIACCQCGEVIGDYVSPFEKRKRKGYTIHPDIRPYVWPYRE